MSCTHVFFRLFLQTGLIPSNFVQAHVPGADDTADSLDETEPQPTDKKKSVIGRLSEKFGIGSKANK